MSRSSLTRVVVLAMVASYFAADRVAYGVDPKPLQSAYYRFEEAWTPDNPFDPSVNNPVGPGSFQPAVADTNVIAYDPGVNDGAIENTVKDSLNSNHMGAWNTLTAPKYVNYSLPPTNLASGAPNLMAWELDGSANGGRDVYTNNDDINNGIVGGMYDPDGNNHPEHLVASTTTGFTLEAAFSVFDVSSFRTIIAKEGLPGTEMGSLDPVVASLPTMALKVRGPQFEGDPDQGKLQIELFDGSGALKSINSGAALQLGEWYYAAVVNDGTTLSLYLDENDGNGYELEGSIPVNGALYQGPNYNNADWDKAWSIGKGVYGYSSQFENGIPADFFNGLIDEIRLTNEALAVEDFLFYQEPAEDGDFNDDGTIDGADFLMWQRGQSTNGLIGSDLQLWKDTFGSATVAGAPIPEPATLGLACLAIVGGLMARRRFLQS